MTARRVADEKACAICGEPGERAFPLRVRVAALNGERLLAHTFCWTADLGDDE